MAAPETLSAQSPGSNTEIPAAKPLPKNDPLHRHVKTAGEHKFNFETYTGVGYFANVLVSLAAVFWVERTKNGQSFLNGLGKFFENFGIQNKTAQFLGRKSFFLAGGFAVVPFMKWLEDAKVERVKNYNREIYGDRVHTDPVIVQSERELEIAPKQSWASMISGRFLALVPFYITVGLLWDRTSKLGLLTNSELRNMPREARKLMAENQPEQFAKIASKGMYFDRPISAFSRDVGKLVASSGKYFDGLAATDNPFLNGYRRVLGFAGKLLRWAPEDSAAIRQIEHMEKTSPGMLRSLKSDKSADPVQAVLPYYAVSEAITSAMVAWGIYVITRVTGPFFGKNQTHRMAPAMAAPAVATPASPTHHGPALQINASSAESEKLHHEIPAVGAAR